MHLLVNSVDIYLFTFSSIIYNIIRLISTNGIIYGFIINQIKILLSSSQKTDDNIIYSVIMFIVAYLLSNVLILNLVTKLYNKHSEYIKKKASKSLNKLYLNALLEKYTNDRNINKIYDLFLKFHINITNYWKSYELHGQIIVALMIIALITKDFSLVSYLSIISFVIVACISIIEYFSPDVFNNLGEYVFTSVMNEKLMLLFLIYMPYIVIKRYTQNDLIFILSVFIVLFWQVSFKNFINGYVKKLELIRLVEEFQQSEKISIQGKDNTYIIADIEEPVNLITYFKLVKSDVTEDEIVKCLNDLSILPEIGNTLNIQMNDNTIPFEIKIKISIARSLLLSSEYSIAYYESDLTNHYEHLIKNKKILLNKLPIKI